MTVTQWFFGLFFKKKYLKGKWFDHGIGWRWCLRGILYQKILGINRGVPFPVSPAIRISDKPRIYFDVDDLDNFQQVGNYFQCENGAIFLGYGTRIAPGVGIITQNHDALHPDRFVPAKSVVIGDHCWIGMNAIILPGVVLGDYTVVGAGAIVTKSFTEGYCTIVGNPAKKVIKE